MRSKIPNLEWIIIFLLFLPGMVLFTLPDSGSHARDLSKIDLSKIVGAKECGECHKSEVHAWEQTHHATTFNLLPRKKETKQISEKMGIRRVKQDSACVNCHFTVVPDGDSLKAISGISCESCHGPAKEWVKIHGDYGGKKVTKEMETPDHKAERLAQIKQAGMINPKDLYRVAENCYQCHTVPNEELVNVGGHKAGSDFELVSWTQGEVRHNFFHSAGKENREASPERKRLMFVVGQALDLEYSLRGVAKATKKEKYAVNMAKRVVAAKENLKKIYELVPLPEINNMLTIADGVSLKLNNEPALIEAAEKIEKETNSLLKNAKGEEWQKLDSIIPPKYKGDPPPAPPGK
jgi:hypothetical protein